MLLRRRRISELHDEIIELFDENTKQEAFKVQQTLRRFAVGCLFFLGSTLALGLVIAARAGTLGSAYRFFFDTSHLFVKIVTSSLGILSDSINSFGTVCIIIHYYSFCVYVKLLYRQLANELLKLNDRSQNRDEIIKRCVELHVSIEKCVHEIQQQFADMMLCDSICLTAFIGAITYTLVNYSLPLNMLMYLPFVFLLMFIICYGGFLIANESERTAETIYMELDWYDYDSKSLCRSLQIIMQRLQNPCELRLLRMQRVNLEHFVDVS